MITSSHLARHNIKTQEYIAQYGRHALTSEEYRARRSQATSGKNNPNYGKHHSDAAKQSISRKNKGKAAWNKGITLEDTEIYKTAARQREQRYQSGELERPRITFDQATKDRISQSLREYAKNNHTELSQRAHKALKTKLERGQDLAFFKGKTHTASTKQKISESSRRTGDLKREKARAGTLERIQTLGLTLVNSFDDDMLLLRCNSCQHEFEHTYQMFSHSKINEKICQVCFPRDLYRSKKETELFDYIKTLAPDSIANYRYLTRGELDVYVPSKNLAVEFNGLYWHSELTSEYFGLDKLRDYYKMQRVRSKGVRLITIFEDEWELKKDIVKSRIKHILGANTAKIFARDCEVKELSSSEAAKFCAQYHLQGRGRSNARFGLIYQDRLVAVMTFSQSNISRKVQGWELNRYCTVDDTVVVGGASRLFKAFVKQHQPEQVVTYADQRWSDGGLYEKLGFERQRDTAPGYWYIQANDPIRYHRYGLRKNLQDDPSLSEWENRKLQGWNRIWDCGNSKWLWTPKK